MYVQALPKVPCRVVTKTGTLCVQQNHKVPPAKITRWNTLLLQWEESDGWWRRRRRRKKAQPSPRILKVVRLIYEASVIKAACAQINKKKGEEKRKEKESSGLHEQAGGSVVSTQRWGHIHMDVCIRGEAQIKQMCHLRGHIPLPPCSSDLRTGQLLKLPHR